jgi:hypothetical protein
MLDPASEFTLSDLPGITLYADHESVRQFYAVPKAPRVAVDESGKPLIGLLLYQRGKGPQAKPGGGQFSLTTDLDLSAAERKALQIALSARLASLPLAATDKAPEVVSPDWLAGSVELRLTDHIKASGTPSMSGTNRCTFSLTLDAESASKLRDAWDDGLPGATITYVTQVNAAQSSSAAAKAADILGKAGLLSQHNVDIHINKTEAVRHALTVQGPVPFSGNALKDYLTIVNL